jgi:predicted aconitase with swiveling domain
MRLEAEALCPGEAEGELLLLQEPLSFWGGMDLASGVIIDQHHPQRGSSVSGRILAMSSGRGSSSSTSVLAEAIRTGTAPAGIVLAERDIVIALGAMIADMLYGRRCPVVRIPAASLGSMPPHARLRIVADLEGAHLEILDEGTDA